MNECEWKGDNVKGTQRGFSQDILHGHGQRWGEQKECISCILTEKNILKSATWDPCDIAQILWHDKIMSLTSAQQVHPVILQEISTTHMEDFVFC